LEIFYAYRDKNGTFAEVSEGVEYQTITTSIAGFLSRMNFVVYWGVMRSSLMSDMFGTDANPSGLEKIRGSKYPG
jgi:hypothetical protein